MPPTILDMKKTVNVQFEPPACALERHNPTLAAKKSEGDNVINIYSTIGEYGDGNGMTPKVMTDLLKQAAGKPVTLNINSPGGDFFEGVAIHTLLKEYDGTVNVNVVGLAASAASIVAMAGDEVKIAPAGFFMVHNAWTIALGNKEVMGQVVSMLEAFDKSMAELYAEATGLELSKVMAMMKDETWIASADAVEMGFAHSKLDDEDISVDGKIAASYNPALKKVDVALAKAGMPRSKRRELIKELTADDTQNAVEPATPRAGAAYLSALETLSKTVQQLNQRG